MDYNARFYDPYLARFISPDTLIPQPGNPLAWDRYAYVNNSPINNIDITGHMIDNGCRMSGCTGNPNAIIHIIYMGGFPAIPKPNVSNFDEKVENSFDPQGKPDPSAGISLVNDFLEQIMVYKYNYDSDEIYTYIKYEETLDKSIEITSIELSNKSNRYASVGSLSIVAYQNPCILSGPDYAYTVVTPRIGLSNSGLGVVSPNNRKEIRLTSPGDQNPMNYYEGGFTINIAARFYMYFPNDDSKYLYRTLKTTIDR